MVQGAMAAASLAMKKMKHVEESIRMKNMADAAASRAGGSADTEQEGDVQFLMPESMREEYRGSQRVVEALADLASRQEGHDVSDEVDADYWTLSWNRLEKEITVKLERARRATQGWRYLLFFVVYAATMILQKKAWRSVLTSDALVSLYLGSAYPDVLTAGVPWNDEMGPEPDKSGCYTESCSTPTYQHKTFLEIETVVDIWDWMENLLLPTFFVDRWENGEDMTAVERNTLLMRMRPIGPMRWTQKRALPGSVTAGQLGKDCVAHISAEPIKLVTPTCYDMLSQCQEALCMYGHEQTSAFGVFTNRSKYPYQVINTGHRVLHPTVSGYQTSFPAQNITQARNLLNELKNDRWIDQSTQWLNLAFTVLNADEDVFVDLQFIITLHNTGLITPSLSTDVTPTSLYNFKRMPHVIRFILEVLTLYLFLCQQLRIADSIRRRRAEVARKKESNIILRVRGGGLRDCETGETARPGWHEFHFTNFGRETSVIEVLQNLLFFACAALWSLIVFDHNAGKTLTRPEGITSESGAPLFPNRDSLYFNAYWIINGIMILLFDARLLGFARVNPKFSLLAETFDHMLGRLFNFAVVITVFLVFFAMEAVILFGDRLAGFSVLGISVIECISMSLGFPSGGTGAKGMLQGGGYGAVARVDYRDLADAQPQIAWIFYFPFVFVMTFITLNATVSIIGETYTAVKAMQDPKSHNFQGAPSEKRAGQVTSVWHQLKTGVASRLRYWYTRLTCGCGRPVFDHGHVSKTEILGVAHTLKQGNHKELAEFDADCSSLKEVSEMLGMATSVEQETAKQRESREAHARDQARWLAARYPDALNTVDDLSLLLHHRLPASANPVMLMSQFEVAVESLVSRQTEIHARVDYLISLLVL